MNVPLLTICIPAYNRPKTLYESLEIILPQLTPEVEVLVVDDGSNEDIRKVVEQCMQKTAHTIRFEKNAQNLGFDRNLLRCIELAKGDYCWFLSDDDLLKKNSIATVISLIKNSNPNTFILVNYSKFDNETRKFIMERMIGLDEDEKFDSVEKFFFKETPKSYFEYLGKNVNYMSISIFPRSYWLKHAKSCEKYIGTSFLHLFLLMTLMIKEKMSVLFFSTPVVLYRIGFQREWPNHVWVAYHTRFIQYLKKLGLSKSKLRTYQVKYFLAYRNSILSYYFKKIFR